MRRTHRSFSNPSWPPARKPMPSRNYGMRSPNRNRRVALGTIILLAALVVFCQVQILFVVYTYHSPHRELESDWNQARIAGIRTVLGNSTTTTASALNEAISELRETEHGANDVVHQDAAYLSPFVTHFLDSNPDTNLSAPIPYNEKICLNDTSNAVLEIWKQNHRQLICDTILPAATAENTVKELKVDEYVLQRWKNQPTIVRYENAEAWSMGGPNRTRCRPVEKDSRTSRKNTATASTEESIVDTVYVNATVIRIVPFDVHNSYERFHAYVNVAMIMIMLDIRDPQLVFVSDETEERDMEMWRLFSKLEPMFVPQKEFLAGPNAASSQRRYRFREIIEAPASDLSMLNTVTEMGPLLGRGSDHHCKSILFQGIVEWIKHRMLLSLYPSNPPERSIDSHDPKRPIRILWSSRQPYCCRNNSTVTPKRILGNETEWIHQMGTLLGPGYTVTRVDFGTVSTFESIRRVAESDILVGVHGAGLIWSVFLPLGTSGGSSRSGLVEIFGGDRRPTNRHYHNVASLVGIPYRETRFWRGSDKRFRWDKNRLDEVVSQIRSIDIQ